MPAYDDYRIKLQITEEEKIENQKLKQEIKELSKLFKGVKQ